MNVPILVRARVFPFIALVVLVAVLSMFFPAIATAQEITLEELVELFIALEIIPPEKAAQARSVLQNKVSVPESLTCRSLVITRTLSLGSRDAETGGEVSKLQSFLQFTGDYTFPETTGYFGQETEKAVLRWQTREGIVSSGTPLTTGYGLVGPRTRTSFAEACEAADTAVEVRTINVQLLGTTPLQMDVFISGVLKNSCVSIDTVTYEQIENVFAFTIDTKLTAATSVCLPGMYVFDTSSRLDLAGLSSGTYTVETGGVKASFGLSQSIAQ